MTTSRVPALIDYLVAEFTTAATLGAATPPVLVFDGPPTTGDPAPLALHVGVDDVFTDAPAAAGTSEQPWGWRRNGKNSPPSTWRRSRGRGPMT